MIRNIAISFLLPLFIVFSSACYSRTEIQIKASITGKAEEIVRLTNLVDVAQKVINDPEFESRIIGASFKKSLAFYYSKDSGRQVFQKIIEKNWDMAFVFQAKKRKCFLGRCGAWAVGWTDPNQKEIYINSLPWPDREDCGIVGTICHERLHKLGYGHPFNQNNDRPFSVPYAVGTVCAEICKKITRGNK